MYVILVYDFKEKRVSRAHKLVRRYLYWRQRSVFDGQITKSDLNELLNKLKKIMVNQEDYVIIYSFETKPKKESIIELGFNKIAKDDIIF